MSLNIHTCICILSFTSFRIFFVLLFCITPQIWQNQYHQWCDPWVIQSDKEINGAEQIFVCGVAHASCLLATHACSAPRLATDAYNVGQGRRSWGVCLWFFKCTCLAVRCFKRVVRTVRHCTILILIQRRRPGDERQTNECLGTAISAFGLPFTWSPWHSWALSSRSHFATGWRV